MVNNFFCTVFNMKENQDWVREKQWQVRLIFLFFLVGGKIDISSYVRSYTSVACTFQIFWWCNLLGFPVHRLISKCNGIKSSLFLPPREGNPVFQSGSDPGTKEIIRADSKKNMNPTLFRKSNSESDPIKNLTHPIRLDFEAISHIF